MLGGFRQVWLHRGIPSSDEEAKQMLAAPARQDDDSAHAGRRLPVRLWQRALHPGRLWLILVVIVVALGVLGALSG